MFRTTIIMFLATLGLVNHAQAQINPEQDHTERTELGEVILSTAFAASCEMNIEDGDTSYTIFFQNAESSPKEDVVSFTFKETGGDFEKLYQIISSNISKGHETSVTIPLDDATLKLDFVEYNNKWTVIFGLKKDENWVYSKNFRQKHIDKLFGK